MQIRRKPGIEGVLTNTCTWRNAPGKGAQGAQIDMLLDRQDRCINICEMKFSGTKKTLFPTMITTYGTRKNEYYLGRIQTEVLMEDLFV